MYQSAHELNKVIKVEKRPGDDRASKSVWTQPIEILLTILKNEIYKNERYFWSKKLLYKVIQEASKVIPTSKSLKQTVFWIPYWLSLTRIQGDILKIIFAIFTIFKHNRALYIFSKIQTLCCNALYNCYFQLTKFCFIIFANQEQDAGQLHNSVVH